jgi:hypothetical protein
MHINKKYAAFLTVAGLVVAGSIAHGQNSIEGTARQAAKIRKGFAISPVPLDLTGKNPDLVGYGSYLVNTNGCNDCHSPSNQTTYAPGGNPFFGQPKKVNPVGFLGGGQDFGPFPGVEHLYTRNLTPDKTGLPLGGDTFAEFVDIMRNGTDPDKIHPSCSPGVTTNCLPPPFNGDKLMVMPWPMYQDLDDYDLLAIYQYLSAIPCVAGPADKTNLLHHECK